MKTELRRTRLPRTSRCSHRWDRNWSTPVPRPRPRSVMSREAHRRRHPGRFLIYVAAAAALSLAAAVPGLDLHHRSGGGGTSGRFPARTIKAPKTGAYLGAFVNTQGTNKGGTFQVVLANLPTFTQQMGRSMAIVPAYQSWAKPWVRNENLTKVADT